MCSVTCTCAITLHARLVTIQKLWLLFAQLSFKNLHAGIFTKQLTFSQNILFDYFYPSPFPAAKLNFKPKEQWASGIKVGYTRAFKDRLEAVIDVQRTFSPATFTEQRSNEASRQILQDETRLARMIGDKIEISNIDIRIGIKYRIV